MGINIFAGYQPYLNLGMGVTAQYQTRLTNQLKKLTLNSCTHTCNTSNIFTKLKVNVDVIYTLYKIVKVILHDGKFHTFLSFCFYS